MLHSKKKTVLAATMAAAMLVPLAACGDGNSTADDEKIDLSNPSGEITVWGWGAGPEDIIKAFEKKYPDVKVKWSSTGTAADTAMSLNNAVSAGSGAPDVTMILGSDVSKYAQEGSFTDLNQFGADELEDDYVAGSWKTGQYDGKTYGIPMDSGPMALFYNKEVFDKAGVTEAPKTWDEYYEAAKKIHALGDNYYITSDTGDAGFYDSMTWLAGATPFSTSEDGSEVTINLTGDENAQKYNEYWQKMLDEGLIDTKTAGWSEDWFKGMVDGTIASLITGAWMPANLVGSAADGAGKWQVALTPTADGSATNSENGGSSLAVLASSEKADAAWQFIEYANHGDGVATRVNGGAFPADTKSMEDSEWLNKTTIKNADGEEVDYFAGQKYNEVLAQSAKNVSTDYKFLPFEVKARSTFGDFVGKSYTGDQKLADGVAAWQESLKTFAKDQGFTVK